MSGAVGEVGIGANGVLTDLIDINDVAAVVGGADEITFTGIAPGKFIAAISRHARSEGKEKDNEWQADFAASCFQGSGKVLKWYRALDEDVQMDWGKLSKAVLETFGKSEVKEQDVSAEEESKEDPQSREDQCTPGSEKYVQIFTSSGHGH